MKARFRERLWDVALVGLPFAVFKVGAGWFVHGHLGEVAGLVLIAWGVIDAVLNIVSLVFPRAVGYCLLSSAGRLADRVGPDAGRENILLAADSLLSFMIVAAMIWFGLLAELPPVLARLWDAAVVCNVVGAGVGQLRREFRTARG